MIADLPRKHASPRNFIAVGAAAGALAIGLGVGVARAADERLDLADAALEKAAVLLQESQAGLVSGKQRKTFDKAIARAIADVEDARAEIAAAKDTVDNP